MSISDDANSLLKEKDLAAAIELLSRQENPEAFVTCMTDLYWKEKNLPASVAIAHAGIGVALSRNQKSTAKALCYNIASFTWNGWDEPGFTITPADLAVGLQAAQANLRLAIELTKPDIALSRAHWILAGHHLSQNQFDASLQHYHEAERHASLANSNQDILLNRAFAELVDLLQNPSNENLRAALDQTKAELKKEKDGEEFLRQLDTVWKVFHKPA